MRRTVGLVAGLVLLLAACGGGDGDAEPAGTTATSTTGAPTTTAAAVPTTTVASTTTIAPTTSTVDESAAVIEAYLGYWEAFYTVTNPGQPDNPIIDRYATGAAADRLRSVAQARLDANEATQHPEPSVRSNDVTVVELTDTTAVVRDCSVDDSFRVNLATGERSNAGVATQLIATELLRLGPGEWVVTEVPTLLGEWQGETVCE